MWEYWTEDIRDYNDMGNFQTQLRKIGQKGWELVTVDNGIAYFKRPVNQPYVFSIDPETGERTPIGVVNSD